MQAAGLAPGGLLFVWCGICAVRVQGARQVRHTLPLRTTRGADHIGCWRRYGFPVRVSHERAALDALDAELGAIAGTRSHRGMAAGNRFAIERWSLAPNQLFQFGDLRLEGEAVTAVVEFESAGSATNLVKYWPLLERWPAGRRFVLAHVFRIQSAGDYIAHRRLWSYLLERMEEDLTRRSGLQRPADWDACAFTYPADAIDVSEVAAYLREALTR
jgi:hypothetical protein